MNKREKVLVAVCALFVCVAATQFAMRGIHNPTGNTGWLGTERAGAEGRGTGANAGVRGDHEFGPYGELGTSISGVRGQNTNGSTSGLLGMALVGVQGSASCTDCYAVAGVATSTAAGGVRGVAHHAGASGVFGFSELGFGVAGTTVNGTGVYGELLEGGGGHAGWFHGRVHVNGTLTKSAGTFRIDHPLDPANKYLSHSFVESPDMKNIYDGVVTLDEKGTAVVELPEWFEALNKDFRYQLTAIGEHAPVYIAQKIRDNKFRIAGGYAGMEVSWQVTGSRNDAYAKAYPIATEELKPPHEMGRFLHPELHGAPMQQRVGFVERSRVRK